MKRRREKTRPSSSSRTTQWSLIEQRNYSKCATASSRRDRNNIPGNPTGYERSNQFLRNLHDLSHNPTSEGSAQNLLSTKIAYRNLPKRRARTALTILAVILGVALLVGISLATASATGEFTNYINKFWGQTDIVVSYGAFPPVFQAGNLARVQSAPEVAQTAIRLLWFGALNKTPVQLVGVNQTDFDYASLNITGAKILSANQTTIDDGLAQKLGIGIGSTIQVFSIDATGNNVSISFSVVGINHPLRNIGASVYVNLLQLQSDLNFQGLISHIYATINDSTRAPQVRDEIQRFLGSPLFNVSAPKAEAVQRIAGQTAGFELGLNVMVAVALIVCAFIVFNTLFMTVNERTYEIGVMRAVGTS